ncbi:hypothetical protein GXM_09169 [Nostoc sphaeroides CCNUC1]|uniref:Uncharacterized protein n=1 Tax=Nostoc sphaeroides CCNUC1 TaxID=2653204 RepID=A0A5P8WFR6_9NOSO|nr:hypothetical protein GXM_09169 [Nostoc sphaeroides CCNUC1]
MRIDFLPGLTLFHFVLSLGLKTREQRDLVRSGKKAAMPSAGCAYAKNYL